MEYKIVIINGDRITEFPLLPNESPVTIGSSENDSIKINGDGVIEGHLSFEYIDGNWTCMDRTAGTSFSVDDYDIFEIDSSLKIAAAIYSCGFFSRNIELSEGAILSVGRKNDNDLVLPGGRVSGRHCVIVNNSRGFEVTDSGSHNGTFVNGAKIHHKSLNDGDIISIDRYNLLLNGSCIEVTDYAADLQPRHELPVLRRPVRIMYQPPSEVIEIMAPPSVTNIPLARLLAFLPRLSMISGLATDIATAFTAFLQQIKFGILNVEQRHNYELYLASVKEKIEEYKELQLISLEASNRETIKCLNMALTHDRSLWERSPSDSDFMKLRIGSGQVVTSFRIKFPNNVFPGGAENKDDMLGRGDQILEEAPILFSLTEGLSLGIVGDRDRVINVMRNILVQAAATHSYKDLRIVTLLPEDECQTWEFVKWLPHSFSDDRSFRYISAGGDELYELTERLKVELEPRLNNNCLPRPFYLFAVASPELLYKSGLDKLLDENHQGTGIAAVYICDSLYELPRSCGIIAELGEKNKLYNKRDAGNFRNFDIDVFSEADAEAFARALAPLRLSGAIGGNALNDAPISIVELSGNRRNFEPWPEAAPKGGGLESAIITLDCDGITIGDFELPLHQPVSRLTKRLTNILRNLDMRFRDCSNIRLKYNGRIMYGNETLYKNGVWDGSRLTLIIKM